MKEEVYKLTEEGKAKLEFEREDLISVQRPRNIEALKEARAQGDLSENADYDAARNEQARIEGRVLEIENVLKNCVIIEAEKHPGYVEVGKKVKVEFVGLGKIEEYTIVGTIEADPFENKISDASPIGVELTKTVVVGTENFPKYKKGDICHFTTDQGKRMEIKILDVTLPE